jgi:hypothetical protein
VSSDRKHVGTVQRQRSPQHSLAAFHPLALTLVVNRQKPQQQSRWFSYGRRLCCDSIDHLCRRRGSGLPCLQRRWYCLCSRSGSDPWPFHTPSDLPRFPQAPAAHLPRSGVILEKTWGGANEQRAESVAEGSRPANCITVARRSEKGNIRPAIRPRDR